MHHLFQHILEGIAAVIGIILILGLVSFLGIMSDYEGGGNPFE